MHSLSYFSNLFDNGQRKKLLNVDKVVYNIRDIVLISMMLHLELTAFYFLCLILSNLSQKPGIS